MTVCHLDGIYFFLTCLHVALFLYVTSKAKTIECIAIELFSFLCTRMYVGCLYIIAVRVNVSALTLSPPVTTFVVCSLVLLLFLGSL